MRTDPGFTGRKAASDDRADDDLVERHWNTEQNRNLSNYE